MKTYTVTSTPQRLLSPILMVKHLLLTEHTKTTIVLSAITPEEIMVRATTITILLQDMLTQDAGYPHWGLNE